MNPKQRRPPSRFSWAVNSLQSEPPLTPYTWVSVEPRELPSLSLGPPSRFSQPITAHVSIAVEMGAEKLMAHVLFLQADPSISVQCGSRLGEGNYGL